MFPTPPPKKGKGQPAEEEAPAKQEEKKTPFGSFDQKKVMQFVSFVLKEAQLIGKDAALEEKTPFDEVSLIEENRGFVFENLPTIKEFHVKLASESFEAPGAEPIQSQATPGKPTIFFY